MNSSQPSARGVTNAYAQGAAYNSPEHTAIITSSQERSRGFGLTSTYDPDYSGTSTHAVSTLLEENHFLYQHAAPVMETLYEQIANTHSMVLLTTRTGTILHSLGDTDFLEKASQIALAPGVDWSEKSKGTNAIGTALTEGQPLVVHGSQHYLKANQFLTCSCTPILDPHGDVIGALDVTGDYRSYHQHTMALARMSAQMIENHMFADVFPTEIRIHFHARPEFIGTIVEGIAVFTTDGRFLSANRSAQFQFGISINGLRAHTFSSLFGIGISQFFDYARSANGQYFRLCLHDGVSVCCKSELKFNNPTSHLSHLSGDLKQASPVYKKRKEEKIPLSSLRYLDTGDPQVASVIQKLRIIQGRDIPIMILGETGTGKDLLAQAIHNDSTRSHKNFVSVNCASIPENLIESELFGYEEGAFTGAKRKGSMGKILFANEGTLFLDEIGDMSSSAQAKVLRALQENKITRVGGDKEIKVNVRIIAATNKDLKQEIEAGRFREDLYHRLAVILIKVPALNDRREDIPELIAYFAAKIASEQGNTSKTFSRAALSLLQKYDWTGNIRELRNVVERLIILGGAEISEQDVKLFASK